MTTFEILNIDNKYYVEEKYVGNIPLDIWEFHILPFISIQTTFFHNPLIRCNRILRSRLLKGINVNHLPLKEIQIISKHFSVIQSYQHFQSNSSILSNNMLNHDIERNGEVMHRALVENSFVHNKVLLSYQSKALEEENVNDEDKIIQDDILTDSKSQRIILPSIPIKQNFIIQSTIPFGVNTFNYSSQIKIELLDNISNYKKDNQNEIVTNV